MRLIDVALAISVCLLGSWGHVRLVSAEGSVGCLFNKALCKSKIEWCFDDNVFGRCVSREDETAADLHRYDLDRDSLRLLRRELKRLLKSGYRWSHVYTQCILEALLFAFRHQKNEYDENRCEPFSGRDETALTYFDENPEEIDPKTVGQVKFTPSVIDPHAEFADEIYVPVFEEAMIPSEGGRSGDGIRVTSGDFRRDLMPNEMDKKKREKKKNRHGIYEDELPKDYLSYLNRWPDGEYETEISSDLEPIIEEMRLMRKAHDSDFSDGGKQMDSTSILENELLTDDDGIFSSFSRNYNTPEKFRKGHETKDEVFYPESNLFVQSNRIPEHYYNPEERRLAYDGYESPEKDDFRKMEEDGNGVYTEGGVVYLKEDGNGEPDSIEEFVNAYGNWGFKRPERLDVKKPGPSFNTNNYAFDKSKGKLGEIKDSKNENRGKFQIGTISKETTSENLMIRPEKKKGGSPMESPILRRQTTTVSPTREKGSDGNGVEYAYVTLKNRVNTWQEGSRIVRKIEDMLNLRQNTFYNVRVDGNEVKFKVDSNRVNSNASEVTKRIEAIKDSIQRAIGVEVMSTGVGNLANVPTSTSLLGEDEHQLWILSFLLCGIIAASVIAATVFFIIRKHPRSKEKIKNLTQMDSEASKDYQDLCRARMASKTQEAQEKPEEGVAGHRVTNLAKEAEGPNHSPSSRSSTSSWSEEPAWTNMDISTGHMVLSYMEDHLKNKDRLEQEWIALCAYEAEPCAVAVAIREENAKKNRYDDVLPYDHARVVLNQLSNAVGSDYINASTITDHDPRNPAYIATQGPLPNTVADFWQMIWEQGSVVTVMLTRLNENGTATCHRYWPEEGSELYHIYEVHLVSEHIWCDDYLVRSFYLKNLKTSETRTVTQFHFLSWPENGVPLSTKALLEFRRKVNKSYRGRSCPVVVHCSDGVGRTGTYCLIDMVLNRMAKGAKEIDIAATLEHIRDQRPLMVRTKQQFEFVLMAVAEEVHAILKALPANPNHSPPPTVKPKE